MSEAVSESQPYLWGPRVKRAIILGLRAGQLAILGVALAGILVVLLLPLGLSFGLVPIFAVTALALVFVPIKRRTADLWVVVVAQYASRALFGQRRWTSHAHLTGHAVSVDREEEIALPQDLPPGLKGLEILTARTEGLPDLGVIRDGRCYVAALEVQGPGFILADPSDQRRLADGWGSVISIFGVADSLIDRIQWIERTAQEDPAALRNYAREKIPEFQGCKTDDEVEAVLRSLTEDRQKILRSYWDGVALGGPVTQNHECLVALMIDARQPRVYRQLKRIGKGDLNVGACEAMMRQVSALAEALGGVDVTVHGMLTPRLLSQHLRAAFDPTVRRRRGRLEQAGAEEGEHPANFGPRAVAEFPGYVQTDGMAHTVFHVAEFPRRNVGADFLMPVLLKMKSARTVSMTIEPIPTVQAFRQIDRSHYGRTLSAEARQRSGWNQGFRSKSEDEKVERLGAELQAGHVNVRLSTYIAVSAPTREELEWACADAELQAAQSQVELERLWGQQLPALTFTLPLCRGL